MCVSHLVHYHHIPPCPRAPTRVVHYTYCPSATFDPVTYQPLAPCGLVYPSNSDHEVLQLQQQQHMLLDNNACVDGQCLLSPYCASGVCRLQDLNGLWTCCQCRRGHNTTKYCRHTKTGSPDTFCYHLVCHACTSDVPSMG